MPNENIIGGAVITISLNTDGLDGEIKNLLDDVTQFAEEISEAFDRAFDLTAINESLSELKKSMSELVKIQSDYKNLQPASAGTPSGESGGASPNPVTSDEPGMQRQWGEFWTNFSQNSKNGWGEFTTDLHKASESYSTTMKSMTDLGTALGDTLQSVFKNTFDDVLTGRLKTFQEFFETFGNLIVKTMEKMATEWASKGLANMVTGAGSSFLSGLGGTMTAMFADGGVMNGPFLPFKAAADGAVFNQPTMGLIGEGRYPEAVIPMPSGNSIPVQFTGGGNPAPQPPMNVSLHLNGRELANALLDMSQTGALKLDTNVLLTNGQI